MATFEIRPITPVYFNEWYRYRTPPLADSQTFLKGAPVVITAGKTNEAGTNPALIAGFTTADADSYDWNYDTLGMVEGNVPIALSTHEFRGTLVGTFAAADVGATFGVTKGGDGVWYVDRAKSASNQRVTITGTDDEVAVGDVNVPVTFVVLPANRQAVV